jgi:2-polyprenyl-3-methyl-5-hydroxy-6-metoxy-1,4-benzoquinol methylase
MKPPSSAASTTAAPWGGDVEVLGACPACDSSRRSLAFGNVRDVVFGVAGGDWQVQRCADCRSLYLDPRPTRSSILLAYDQYFTHEPGAGAGLLAPRTLSRRLRNDYLAARFGYALPNREPFGRQLLSLLPASRQRCERLLRDLAAPSKPSRLLDVGSGNGEFLVQMRELGWSVAGHDVDPKAAALVRSFGIEVAEGALRPDSFSEPFDAITLHHVLEHVHDPLELLLACRALLKPGGRLWLATPNAQSFAGRRFGRYWPGLDSPRHLVIWSAPALDGILARAGFRERAVRPNVGRFGVVGASAALARGHGARGFTLPARLENVIGDAVMLLVPGLGDDLVAEASG